MKIQFSLKRAQKNNFFVNGTIISSSLLLLLMGVFLWPNTAFLSDITAENIIIQTNLERLANQKAPLTRNQALNAAALAKAQAIFQAQNFQHQLGNQTFSAWIKEAGYAYSYVGENLALDFVSSQGAVNAWLQSPAHRKNLLNERFQEIGVAVVTGELQGRETVVVVQLFGTPPLTANNEPDYAPIAADKYSQVSLY